LGVPEAVAARRLPNLPSGQRAWLGSCTVRARSRGPRGEPRQDRPLPSGSRPPRRPDEPGWQPAYGPSAVRLLACRRDTLTLKLTPRRMPARAAGALRVRPSGTSRKAPSPVPMWPIWRSTSSRRLH